MTSQRSGNWSFAHQANLSLLTPKSELSGQQPGYGTALLAFTGASRLPAHRDMEVRIDVRRQDRVKTAQ
jgi:hypothetical protein